MKDRDPKVFTKIIRLYKIQALAHLNLDMPVNIMREINVSLFSTN